MFNAENAFRKIDKNKKGFITPKDVSEFLNRPNIDRECNMFV